MNRRFFRRIAGQGLLAAKGHLDQTMETANVLMAIGGIVVFAAMAVLRKRNLASRECRAAAAAAVNHYRRTRDKADLGLVCPACGAVAEPMCDTHDRYRCVGCKRQFTAERHEWKTE